MVRYMIDSPTPFAALEEWEDFRRELLSLDQDDDAVKYCLAEAERNIARLKAEQV